MLDFKRSVSRQKRWLDLAPMIDVVFLLLIFFMLTSIYAKPMIPVSLPESETASVQDEPDITIGITRSGELSLNSRSISFDRLPDALSQLLSSRRDKSIRLIADKATNFGLVVTVMDIAKMSGADNIAVVTEKVRE